MKPKRIAIIVATALLLMGNDASADEPRYDDVSVAQPLPSPHVRLSTFDGLLIMPGGRYVVPQGSHILDEDTFLTVEREMKRLQEQETRLKAENKVLSEDSSGVSWPTLVIVGLGALALGATSVYFAQ